MLPEFVLHVAPGERSAVGRRCSEQCYWSQPGKKERRKLAIRSTTGTLTRREVTKAIGFIYPIQ